MTQVGTNRIFQNGRDTECSGTFTIAFDWFHQGSDVDIDISGVCYSGSGELVDAVYYNNLSVFNGGLVHSGDAKGKEGQESLTFDLSKLDNKASVIIVSAHCYHADTFKKCHGMTATFKHTGSADPFEKYHLKRSKVGQLTGLIYFMIYQRSDTKKWYIKPIQEAVSARNFKAAILHMRELLPLVLNKNQMSDFVAGNEKSSFDMKKGGCVFLPEGEITELHVGLGWDLGDNGASIDLDAGCVELQDVDHDGDLDPMAYIYFGNLQDGAGAIEGANDNISGAGDGDDETMKIHLAKIPASIEAVAVCVSNYKSTGFTKIKNAYMRLFSPGGHEYLKFSLTDMKDCTKNSIIFCMLERSKKPAGWNVVALGHPADGNTVHAIKTDLWDITGTKNEKAPATTADVEDDDDDNEDVNMPPPPPTVAAPSGVRGVGGASSRKRPQVTESAGCCTIM